MLLGMPLITLCILNTSSSLTFFKDEKVRISQFDKMNGIRTAITGKNKKKKIQNNANSMGSYKGNNIATKINKYLLLSDFW